MRRRWHAALADVGNSFELLLIGPMSADETADWSAELKRLARALADNVPAFVKCHLRSYVVFGR